MAAFYLASMMAASYHSRYNCIEFTGLTSGFLASFYTKTRFGPDRKVFFLRIKPTTLLEAVYMRAGTGCLPGRNVTRDPGMYVFL